MMAPPAEKKGGQKRLETKSLGITLSPTTVVKANVEESAKGETVALVMKGIHTHNFDMFIQVKPSLGNLV